MKLKSALRSLDPQALDAIRQFWGLPEIPGDGGEPPDRDFWVNHLYSRLQNAANFRAAYAKLDD
ncbi:MAG TPA: hypothetical protein VM492_13885, partial [Sumerlaeia bacterium]|nr:hypothetical protein [Sumerlaeia bacterium]